MKATKGEGENSFRVGYIVTKKLGKAVQRNRIKRRLREAVRATFYETAPKGYDYLLIARVAALTAPYDKIKGDLTWALGHLKRQIESDTHA